MFQQNIRVRFDHFFDEYPFDFKFIRRIVDVPEKALSGNRILEESQVVDTWVKMSWRQDLDLFELDFVKGLRLEHVSFLGLEECTFISR
jgi:hypothetical protein